MNIATPSRLTLRLPRSLETDLEQWARVEIASAGGLMLKWVCPGMRGPPDNICFWYHPTARREYKKIVHFLEFKLAETEPDAGQVLFHEALRRMGHEVFIPRDREWVRKYIRYWTAP